MKTTLTLIASALLLTAAPAFAQTKVEGGSGKAKAGASASGKKLSVVGKESMDGDDGQRNVVSLRVEDGKISVTRNGKEVPQDQIKRNDDGSITILDENGKEVDSIHLFTGHGEGGLFGNDGLNGFNVFRGGNGEGNTFWGVAGDDNGEAPKVMLGVHMTEPGAALEKHLHLDAGKSAMITGIFDGLSASEAGIGEYDIIVKIDDSDAADGATIRKILTDKKPGDTITLHVIQAGKAKDLKVKLQAFDADKLHAAKLIGKEPDQQMWSSLQPLKDMAIDLKGLENLPNLKNRVFITPDVNKLGDEWRELYPKLQSQMGELQPQIEKSIQDALKHYQGAIKQHEDAAADDDAKSKSDVDAQLDQLDKRMAQLESLLQKLLEKQQPKP